MSDQDKKSIDQYGRQKWNVDVYAQEARDKKRKVDHVTSSSQYVIDKNVDDSKTHIKQRNTLLEESLNAVQTFNLINPDKATTTTFGTNKRFGFVCPVCNLSFRDNLALIDHFNSPQHVSKVFQSNKSGDQLLQTELLDGGIRRATLEEVVSVMENLVAKRMKEKSLQQGEGPSFTQRVEMRKKFEDEKKRRRLDKRKLQSKRKKQRLQTDVNHAALNSDINEIMGFTGFGSSKPR
ncbi:SNU23 [Candida margitis]|uniref:SNU23 n=1 Tax=Candida margitis TaxID=1775924 RepID=UPI002225D749|nr:SNU23 [Candida margitis]KAI5954097.1 SNU23 [Candida margitis]